jgi:dTDP-4-dehydrorhamnose reductase
LVKVNPDVIINAIGLTIRRGCAKNISDTIYLNSFFPHQLSNWAVAFKKRLIHFSTDCVFSGSEGSYLEDATPDALDYYGKTKGLGEVNSKSSLTIRSSMIGPELFNKTELFEWIINNKEKEINGFSRVMYSGVTTVYMSKLVADLIDNHKNLSGIYNVASKPISKFELLHLINDNFDLGLIINDDKTVISNKTLNASKIEKEIGLQTPSWDELIFELKKDYMNFIDLYKTI